MAADPGHRPDVNALHIAFDYTGTVSEEDIVEIAADRMVQRISSVGSIKVVGRVTAVRTQLTPPECTVRTPFVDNRQDRIAGEAVPVGPFVWGPESKVYAYSSGSPARHDGATTGPVTVQASTNDAVKVRLEGGGSQDVTLTAGADITFAAIAAELNAGLTGITAEVDADGNINLVADEIGKTIEVEAVANDAYTLLGWTAGVYYPTMPSHDASAIAGLVVVGTDTPGNTVETLELR